MSPLNAQPLRTHHARRAIALATLSIFTSMQTLPVWAQVQTTTTQYEYDAQGNRTKATDPRSQATVSGYDSLNRLLQTTQPVPATGGSSPIIKYSYDGADQLNQVTDPRNLNTSYTTTGLGDTTQQVSPDTGATGMTFDAAGNLKTRVDARNKTVTYTYDNLNRLTKIDYPTGTDTLLEYDGGTVTPTPANAKGRLTKLTDESGTTAYTYDGYGRVLTKTQTVGTGTSAKVQTVTYAYGAPSSTAIPNAATGKLVSMTYPSGNRINYSYDGAGQIQSLSLNPTNTNGVGTNTGSTINLLTSIQYQPMSALAGLPKSWVWGNAPGGTTPTTTNGHLVQRTYDVDGRLTSFPLGHASQGGLTRTLTYDAASRITGATHTATATGVAQPTLDHSFGYDNLDRLTSWTQNTTSHGYSYDATGNRTQFSIGGTTYANAIQASSNKLDSAQYNSGTATATRSFTYDAAGNATALTSTGNEALTLTISDRGRLKSTAKTVAGTAKTISYFYNALEQRVRKSGPSDQVATGNQYYVYDEAGHLLGEYDNTLKVVQETIYLNDTPVVTLKQSTTGTAPNVTVITTVHYIYADQIDTPRIITRASDNKMVWRWDATDPFGTLNPNENPQTLGAFGYNPRFPGQVFDKESNLFYNINRDYDSQIGRYIQSDPIGLRGGLGTYSYVLNQPNKWVDPAGLQFECPGGTRSEPRFNYNTGTSFTVCVPDPLAPSPRRCATAECAAGLLPAGPMPTACDLECGIGSEDAGERSAACGALAQIGKLISVPGAGFGIGTACKIVDKRACKKRCEERAEERGRRNKGVCTNEDPFIVSP
jgi:RHS repeat-associated protein